MIRQHCNRFLWLTFLLLPGCVNLTVNVYFPEPELREAAEVIESDIRGISVDVSMENTNLLYKFSLPGGAVLAFELRDNLAYAQGERARVNVDVETPAILKIRTSRKERYKEIEPFLDTGRLGEGLDGFIILRDPKDLGLRDLQALKKLIAAENKDREALYGELAEALKQGKDQIKRIQEDYAKVIWEQLKPGHYFVESIDKEGNITWKVKPEPEKKQKK